MQRAGDGVKCFVVRRLVTRGSIRAIDEMIDGCKASFGRVRRLLMFVESFAKTHGVSFPFL